jgi:hypothetical protein
MYFPFVFNLMIDAILRAADVDDERDSLVKPTIHFYADDGRFAGDNRNLIQAFLDKFWTFAAVGLEVNASKTVSMTSS